MVLLVEASSISIRGFKLRHRRRSWVIPSAAGHGAGRRRRPSPGPAAPCFALSTTPLLNAQRGTQPLGGAAVSAEGAACPAV